jgi:hypothetical protein
MKYIILTFTLLALCTAGVCQVLETQNEFNNSYNSALTSQIKLQSIVDDMPLNGDCRQYNACTPGSCNEINACSDVDEDIDCQPNCLLELMSINPYNPLNYTQPIES